MFLRKVRQLKFEKDSNYVTRVLILTFPAALVFVLLVALRLLTPYWALLSYVCVIIFNMVFMLPFRFELMQVKTYIQKLAQGENERAENMALSDTQAREIADAVNSMHHFWAYKVDTLEAKTMSDAAVLDTLPDPILMIDSLGNIIGANLSARKLLGENVLAQNVENVFAYNHFINAVNRILNKETEAENLFFYVHADLQQKMYAHIKALPWFSKGGAVAVISLYDISKSLTVEKMQSDFVANASHELKTPLSVISGFIETLQTTAKDDETARHNFLKIMADQVQYMSSLIENLLSLSRIEMQMNQRPSEKINVPQIIDETIEALGFKLKERQMKIKTRIKGKIPLIPADASQLRQLFQNLLDNALKYGLGGSTVDINIHIVSKVPSAQNYQFPAGKFLAVSVHNQGSKIKSEDISRLTERFYRIQEHKDLNIKGTGLGLAIAKQIVRRHQGNLTVSSSHTHGTTFTVYLPVHLS